MNYNNENHIKSKIKTSIIIRSYNEARYLSACLSAVNNQCIDSEVEVILVDSGSTDKTIEIARNYGCKIIEIQNKDFTYGYSLNVGISKAEGEYVVVISAHCVPADQFWLNSLISPLINGEASLTFGSQQADPNARCSEFNFFEKKYNSKVNSKLVMDRFNNGNSAFTKSIWIKRQFDEKIKAQEDVLFARWHASEGSKIIFVPNSIVIHYHNYNNHSLFKRLSLDSEVNSYLLVRNGALPEKKIRYMLGEIYNDIKLAFSRKVFIKALPGIFCFRIIELVAYINGEINKKNMEKIK
jgi:glycosyltransferase involved in cell wall biosynthesis